MTDKPEMIYSDDGRPVVETRFRVRFHETDAMGIVHHAAYINWFEEGRSSYTRAIGYPYSQLEREGVSLAVAEVSARYHRPAHYDDEVIVATCLEQLGSRGMTFAYEIRRASDGELLVSGHTSHISVNREGRVIRLPDRVRERYSGGRA
jgi:acyl-CoA thioester hydrolase